MLTVFEGFMIVYFSITSFFMLIASISSNQQDKDLKGELTGAYLTLMGMLLIAHVLFSVLNPHVVKGG